MLCRFEADKICQKGSKKGAFVQCHNMRHGFIEKFSENVHNSKVGKAEYMSGMREPDIVYNALPNTF